MRSALVALIICSVALLAPGCGGADEPPVDGGGERSAAPAGGGGGGKGLTGAGADRSGLVGKSGTARATACELVGSRYVEGLVAGVSGRKRELEREANDSLDLSICWFRSTRGPIAAVSLTVDTATRAVRRYYNQITEARQLPNIFDPSPKFRPTLVRNVGEDGTYGGAGAFWIPVRATLTSIRDQVIVKAHFYVEDVADGELMRAAAKLARLAYRRYPNV